MRHITYYCDCCKQEIPHGQDNVGAPNAIFGQYGKKAAYDIHVCSPCIVRVNEATDAVMREIADTMAKAK